jgi:acetyl esterase/lipase
VAVLAGCRTAAPLRVLPPALIVNGEHNVLRDEGEAYARKISRADMPVTQVLDLVQVLTYPFACSAWFLIMIGRFATLESSIVCASHPCTT